MLSNGNFKSLGDFDYMYACGESDDKSHASFSFNHIGCVVEFKLKAPTTANYTTVYFEMYEATEDNYLVKKGSVDVSAAECVFSPEKFTNDSLLKVSLGEKGISVQKDSFLTDLNNINMNLVEFPSTRYCAWHSGDPAPARITKSGNRIVINNDDNGIEVYTITSPEQLDYTTGISMPSSSCCNAITSTPLGRLFVGSRTGDCSIFMFDGLR